MHSMALRRSANYSFVRIQLVTSEIDKSRFSEIFIDKTDKTDINFSVSLLEPPLLAKINGVKEPCSTCKTL